TYHGDPTRSGLAAGPSLGDVLHAWTSPTLDGDVYAEPLVVGRLVLTATENDTVYALDARTGRPVWRSHLGEPVQRSTLPCGLFGDCGSYHGWVASVSADGSGPLLDYRAPTVNAGGIWAPSGPAVGPDGTMYVTTGNSFSGDAFDHGDSVIALSPDLRELGFF